MSDQDFSMALTVTLIPYILVELPSSLLMRRIGAGVQIPSIVIIWGLVTLLQGLVHSYHVLLTTRFFLGLLEGGLYPALVLYLSMFYSRTELQLRIAFFFSTVCLAGVTSGLLTYAIIKLDGYWGHSGWSWVFLIEGSITSVFGMIGLLLLPSDIKTVKFLTEEEQSIVVSRLQSNDISNLASPTSFTKEFPAKSTSQQFWEALKSPHVVILTAAHFFSAFNISSLAYFSPTIINSFGYSPRATQLYSVPPLALAFVGLLSVSYLSDRYQARGLATICCATLSLLGFVIFYASDNYKVRYGSLFLSTPGTYGVVPSLAAWATNNSAPHSRKATTIALNAISAGLGGLLSIWIFVLGKKPRYYLPTGLSIAFGVLLIVCCVLNILWLNHAQQHKSKKRNEILSRFTIHHSEGGTIQDEGYQNRQELLSAQAWDHLGDQHPDFEYAC
ncbi:hypothetical protein PGTUg99_005364 [Puccinia graminis f. sp. tritici]|nr:hypothetical protein, variant [Puccinia graminis f. sp. tritici CRL 75-36-700-3]EHS63238.1 hypothetical protein, variant [Puccinia graminis f. sp. tritici CRL 75-36-700-3]KAA1100636.1 hypothetical protein PGTUg99_005364 [Puccinia graminis f. sp. tritici]